MCSELKFLDSVDIKCKTVAKFLCEKSEDNYVAILTDRGVIVCGLHSLKESTNSSVSYYKKFIPPSKYVLSAHLGIDIDPLLISLKRSEVYESVLRSDISPCIYNCNRKCYRPTSAKWSPAGLVGEQPVLAISNDVGSLEIYLRVIQSFTYYAYVPILNITELIIEQYRSDWIQRNFTPSESFNELKRRIEINMPIAFTWSHIIKCNDISYCILIIALMNGRITFWKFKQLSDTEFKEASLEFMFDKQTFLENITCLHWKRCDNAGLLIIGDSNGNVTFMPVLNLDSIDVGVSCEATLNDDSNIKVDAISTTIVDDTLCIYVVKQDHIFFYLMNDDSQVIDLCTFNIGNFQVTCIEKIDNSTFIVLTLSGVLKELKLKVVDGKLSIDWRHLYVSINWSIRRSLGFFISPNNLIYTFITDASTVIDMKEQKETFQLTSFLNKMHDPLKLLLDNPTNSLYGYYDCLEALRLTAIQDKQPICSLLPQNENYDTFNLLKLKTYLHIAKTSEYIYDQYQTACDFNIKPFSEIYTMIEIKLAVYYIQKILNKVENKSELTEFHKKSFKQLVSFLREAIMEGLISKYGLHNNFRDEVFDVLSKTEDVELSNQTDCIVCGNELLGSLCYTKHFDNRCAITMTQIVFPKYQCPLCKRCVSEEAIAEFEVKLCPFCDTVLNVLVGTNEVKLVWLKDNIETIVVDDDEEELT